jgi:hypothetical protein
MFGDEPCPAAQSGMNPKIVLRPSQIHLIHVVNGRELLWKMDLAKPITFTYWLTKADVKAPINRYRSGHGKYGIASFGYPYILLNNSDKNVYYLLWRYKDLYFAAQCIYVSSNSDSKQLLLCSMHRRICGVLCSRKGFNPYFT